ncbi:MAG: hypothetical protein U0996_06315 [Planctomycetaceae bacterium]
MKWSPPHIVDRKSVSALPASVAAVVFLSGCASLPSLPSAQGGVASAAASAVIAPGQFTPEEKAWLAQMPAVPAFDELKPAQSVAAAPAPVPGVGAEKSSLVPVPLKEEPKTQPLTVNSAATALKPAEPPKSGESISANGSAKVAADNTAKTGVLAGAEQKPGSSEPTRVALANPPASDVKTAQTNRKPSTQGDTKKPAAPQKVEAPAAFAWKKVGKSTGGIPFEMAQAGEEGYRTLVVGSVGGHDPAAVAIVDQLAVHLHENSLILGGYETTFIRTLNPDGLKSRTALNARGQYINHGFPKSGETPSGDQPAEAAFLMSQLSQLQPQRVLHIRTIDGENGLIASGANCQKVAQETAKIMGFRYVALPEKAVAGSFERYLSSRGTSEIITLAIPAKTKPSDAWELYRDTVLNLLQRDDLTTRELARGQDEKASADRRNGK